MANAFFIVHNPIAYGKKPDLIGFYAKRDLDGKPVRDKQGKRIPENSLVSEIEPGDKVVYYTRGDYLIRGIFEVEEKLAENDKRRCKEWDPDIQFKIKMIFPPKTPVDFRNIIFSGKKTLDMFSHLENIKRQWGGSIYGRNYIKKITQHDLEIFEHALRGKVPEEEQVPETAPEFARKHLEMQFKLVKIMKSYGYSVHVARNDKAKIMEKGEKILENIPDFHSERITDITSRIDCVSFSERNVPKILVEVVDTPGTLTESLYRLNEVALVYPKSEDQKFYIVGPETLLSDFNEKIESMTFKTLMESNCKFLPYPEVETMFLESQKKKPKL